MYLTATLTYGRTENPDAILSTRLHTTDMDADGHRLDALLRAIREMAEAPDLPAVADVVRRAARALTRADGVTFVVRDGEYSYYLDEDAISPLWKGRRFPLSMCISGWAMTHGEPVLVRDIYVDTRIPHDLYRATFVKSLAILPVGLPAMAAIGAYWARPRTPARQEIDVLHRIADSTWLRLQNMTLTESLRQALEAERRAREDAEAAARRKQAFLAVVSHELRQPLHAVASAFAIMDQRPGREQGKRARAVAERQLGQMARIVEDLLDASRVTRGEVTLQRSAVDVREIVQHALDTVGPLISERHHLVTTTLPDEPTVVQADAVRLQQVLVNLLSNAAKYTDGSGQIHVTFQRDASDAVITVRDTGAGLTPEELSRVFNLFERGGRRANDGFGLGLAVARHLAEQHGGTLEGRSGGPGQGSEFVLRLPAGQKWPDAEECASGSASTPSRRSTELIC